MEPSPSALLGVLRDPYLSNAPIIHAAVWEFLAPKYGLSRDETPTSMIVDEKATLGIGNIDRIRKVWNVTNTNHKKIGDFDGYDVWLANPMDNTFKEHYHRVLASAGDPQIFMTPDCWLATDQIVAANTERPALAKYIRQSPRELFLYLWGHEPLHGNKWGLEPHDPEDRKELGKKLFGIRDPNLELALIYKSRAADATRLVDSPQKFAEFCVSPEIRNRYHTALALATPAPIA